MSRIFVLGSTIAIAAVSLLFVTTASAAPENGVAKKPKVEAGLRRGQLNVLGTARTTGSRCG